jgi:ribosome recycling factor
MDIKLSESMSIKEFEGHVSSELKKSIDFFEKELSKIRTGRAHVSLIEDVKVQCYGQEMPLKEMAIITTPEPAAFLIQPFDMSIIGEIEKALLKTDLGAQPRIDGKAVRINLPPMSQARRDELAKTVGKKAEEAMISIRATRQDIMNNIKKALKEKALSEDIEKRLVKSLQLQVDNTSKKITFIASNKEKTLQT